MNNRVSTGGQLYIVQHHAFHQLYESACHCTSLDI